MKDRPPPIKLRTVKIEHNTKLLSDVCCLDFRFGQCQERRYVRVLYTAACLYLSSCIDGIGVNLTTVVKMNNIIVLYQRYCEHATLSSWSKIKAVWI
jgi:hypothetical protein